MMVLGIVLFFPLSFTGFFVRDIPVYFQWIKDTSYLGLATATLKVLSLNYNGAKVLRDWDVVQLDTQGIQNYLAQSQNENI